MAQAAGGTGAGRGERRRELVSRLERLGGELAEVEAALAALGGEPLPGLHLVVEVAGRRAILPASRVREVVPLLTTDPIPGAPAPVLGLFLLRGTPVTVLDLARKLGVAREPSLESQIVVLGGERAVGVLVDRVLAVEDGALLVEGRAAADEPDPLARAPLAAALCRWRDEVLPLLHVPSVLRAVEEER